MYGPKIRWWYTCIDALNVSFRTPGTACAACTWLCVGHGVITIQQTLIDRGTLTLEAVQASWLVHTVVASVLSALL